MKKVGDENFDSKNAIESVRANIVPSFDAVAKDNIRSGFATVDYQEKTHSFENENKVISKQHSDLNLLNDQLLSFQSSHRYQP